MTSETLDGGAVNPVAELTRRERAVHLFDTNDGRTFAVLLDPATGTQALKDVTAARNRPPLPEFIEQNVVLTSQQSFIDYVKRFGGINTRLFAVLSEKGGGEIVAYLDYHAGGETAGRLKHVVTLKLKDSEEWVRWSSISSDSPVLSQTRFVQFLEENASDIEAPDGADILEMARDFSAARKVKFDSAIRLENGDQSFEYVSEAEVKSKNGNVTVPNKFRLRIPVFYGEPSSEVYAFLRWNIDDGLKLGIKIHRPVYVRQALFEAIGARVAEALSVPLHYAERQVF